MKGREHMSLFHLQAICVIWSLWYCVLVWFISDILPHNWQWQLQELMETLSSTEPHYIRCIKPNNHLKPATFENINVLQQLRCSVRNGSLIVKFQLNQPPLYTLMVRLSFRVFLKLLESAVLDILQEKYFMIFSVDFAFLLLKFSQKGECTFW